VDVVINCHFPEIYGKIPAKFPETSLLTTLVISTLEVTTVDGDADKDGVFTDVDVLWTVQ